MDGATIRFTRPSYNTCSSKFDDEPDEFPRCYDFVLTYFLVMMLPIEFIVVVSFMLMKSVFLYVSFMNQQIESICNLVSFINEYNKPQIYLSRVLPFLAFANLKSNLGFPLIELNLYHY